MKRRAFIQASLYAGAGLLIGGQVSASVANSYRDYLYRTAPYPQWQDAIIQCESQWNPGATSPVGAAGLAQFMPQTWKWGQNMYGIYGSPYDPYTAIDMMNAFFADGLSSHWDCADSVPYSPPAQPQGVPALPGLPNTGGGGGQSLTRNTGK
jgi:soluble lytic murein transglycosylase-like protein